MTAPDTPPATRVTSLQHAVQMQEIPAERWSVVVRRTVIGTMLVVFGVVGITHYAMNHYLGVGLVLFGATIWSTQLVTNSLKALIQPVAAIKRAVNGETPAE